jgi:hypothetical protein
LHNFGHLGGTARKAIDPLISAGCGAKLPYGLKTAKATEGSRGGFFHPSAIMKKTSTAVRPEHSPGLVNYLALMHAISHPEKSRDDVAH